MAYHIHRTQMIGFIPASLQLETPRKSPGWLLVVGEKDQNPTTSEYSLAAGLGGLQGSPSQKHQTVAVVDLVVVSVEIVVAVVGVVRAAAVVVVVQVVVVV